MHDYAENDVYYLPENLSGGQYMFTFPNFNALNCAFS